MSISSYTVNILLYYIITVELKRVRPPTCFSLKIVLKVIFLDIAQYLIEHLTAAQLHLSKAVYTGTIRAAVINLFKVLDLQRGAWKQLEKS